MLGAGCVADTFFTSPTGTLVERTVLVDACYFVPGRMRNIDFFEVNNGNLAATPTVTAALDVTTVCGP